jgi:hypothetical protein
LLFCIALLFTSHAIAEQADNLSRNNFAHQSEFETYAGVNVRYFGNSGEESQKIQEYVNDANAVFWVVTEYDPTDLCKSQDIDILDITLEEINDRSRMRWVSWYSISHKVYGLYRPTYTYRERSELFISHDVTISERQRAYLVAHELSHYWQDMMCYEQSEEDADTFGRLFMQMIKD